MDPVIQNDSGLGKINPLEEPAHDCSSGPLLALPSEDSINYEDIIIDDDAPVDNFFVEKQYRLLTEPLNSNWHAPGGQPFIAVSDVGLFAVKNEPAIVPDAMLSIGVRYGDFDERQNLSYFIWVMGKPPDVVIEIVSDLRGGEDDRKLKRYAQIGIPYYVIFDPDNYLKGGCLRSFELINGAYHRLPTHFYSKVKLSLTLWRGKYEELNETWLRWCDESGIVIETGAETAVRERLRGDQEQRNAEQERRNAEHHRQNAEQERLRAEHHRQNAEQERLRAEQQQENAEQERRRADAERQLREELEAQLRALGIDPTK